ncbi:MAG TPA: hypothetical protein VMC08_08275, partial [Bacteroidales bacterium]|nr:hypothetical protein [Bacteroidales bacterium]
IKSITDPSTKTYTDTDVPYTSYLEYQVVGYITTGDPYSPQIIYSNIKTYERPEIKTFSFTLNDVIPDLQNNIFYVFESDSGKITRLNFETHTIEKSVNTNAQIGFCDYGVVNNAKQIYVPRKDGWIFIYDAETLNKIDQINFGESVESVVFNDNKLFANGSVNGWYDEGIRVFDCVTKAEISENYLYSSGVRLKLVPGTHTRMMGLESSSYSDIYSLVYDGSGNLVASHSGYLEYEVDQHILRMFPDGSRLITSYEGTIIDTSLQYIVTLPYGNYQFSDFDFKPDLSTIYVCCSNYKKILLFSNPGYSLIQEINTLGYPTRIFYKDNQLICLSSTTASSYYPYSYARNYFIEKVSLP